MNHSTKHAFARQFILLTVIAVFFQWQSQAFVSADSSHNCRLWAIISNSAPEAIITSHLITLPNSLKNLSQNNDDGWGIVYYFPCKDYPIVFRNSLPAYLDSSFDSAVVTISQANPRVAAAHIRRCSSGLCNIPDPHPFVRTKNNRHWLFAHNGTISKNILLNLIRPDYLAANPPQYGGNDTASWIDTDLYFIFILQTLEDLNGEIRPALGTAIELLHQAIPETGRFLNFYLSDGNTIWGYCEGNTLFYMHDSLETAYSAVASQYPSASQESWMELSDGQLVTLSCENPPLVENIENYFTKPTISPKVKK
jgi:predicted glutamine amidotransferase